MNEINKPKIEKASNHIDLTDRKTLNISGVTETVSATETIISLKTNYGPLLITGSALHIENLNKTDKSISITGEINELKYTKSKKSFFQKVFK